MLNVNYTNLNESIKTFILSVAVGSEVVVDSLIETANRHLEFLEQIKTDTLNAKIHFECAVSIITQTYTALRYINNNSVDLFSSDSIHPLDKDIESIEVRFSAALERIRKEIPSVRG